VTALRDQIVAVLSDARPYLSNADDIIRVLADYIAYWPGPPEREWDAHYQQALHDIWRAVTAEIPTTTTEK